MKFPYLAIVILLSAPRIFAQDSTSAQEFSAAEKAALYSMTGVVVPLAIAGLAVSIFPPSGGLIIKDGSTYAVLNLETGFGRGEKRETGIFTDYRVMLNYSHVYSSRIRDIFRVEVKKDFNFQFIDRRKLFLSGVHLSGGLISDFPNHGFTIGSGVWLKTPMLSFFGFFPSHTFGITYRYNAYFSGRPFHEVTAGVASAITF